MNLVEFALSMLVTGVVAGCVGAVLGLGGGIVVTPVLTLLFGVDIKYAIGASIIAVIATSSGATIAYLKDDLLNLRVAMFLEIFTTIGGIIGAVLAGVFNGTFLFLLYSCLLAFQCFNMYKKLKAGEEVLNHAQADKLSEKLKLNSSYFDKATNEEVVYQVEKVPQGSLIMLGAGIASGLLGIGSGAFKVMAMDGAMKMPLKPSSATSNLMMGVTAAASAVVYFFQGVIQPVIAVPLALGIIVGSTIGSRIMPRLPAKTLRKIFIPVLAIIALQMLYRGSEVFFK
nr:sulfite exporter TauE/SafE family protein [Pilibacter termitis]